MKVTEITNRPSMWLALGEAWKTRELAFILARRNIKVRYMQTVLGRIWVIIQPILLAGILTVIFGIFLNVSSDGVSYPLFAFAGTSIWMLLQRGLTDAGISLVTNQALVGKVYFPRIHIPLSAVMTGALDFLPVYALLIVVVAATGEFSGWRLLLSPLFVILALLMALACGLWITIADAVFRDVRLVVPSVMQMVFYLSPIMYSDSVVPSSGRLIYRLNPTVALIKGFRWSLIEKAPPPMLFDVFWTVGFIGVTLVSGYMLFARLETFAVDRI